jgi:aminoglycoside phosphotransferase (APT) family kinase protein
VSARRVESGIGYISRTFRVRLEWDHPDATPRSLIAKLPNPARLDDLDASGKRMFRREAMFHREVAPTAPVRTPLAFAAEVDANTGIAFLLFEDLSSLKSYSDGETVSLEKVQNCLAQLAALHALYWNSKELAEMDWLGHPALTGIDTISSEEFVRNWTSMVDSGAHELSPAHFRLAELLSGRMEMVYEALNAAPETLVHADLHQENLFFDGDDAVFIDWQLAERAPPAKDFAKLTAACLEPAQYASEAPALLRHYHSLLTGDGGVNYSYEDLERHIRLAMCHYMALMMSGADFAAQKARGTARTDFTRLRILPAAGRDEVIAEVEAL